MIESATPDLDHLRRSYEDTYGQRATHLVRSPGRVNLIGEHIDYCGLSVLPAAMARAVWLAFRPSNSGEVRIATDVTGCEPARFAIRNPIPASRPGSWDNYPRAAIAALSRSGDLMSGEEARSGFDAFVSTDLPIASGLSSSSALVVATALAGLYAAWRPGEPEPVADVAARLRLAELLARGERYVGTAGGGMDQAACLLGAASSAIRVDFDPLAATPIPVPSEWRLIIADSGQRAEKSGAAQETYNARTEETRRAAQWAWSELGQPEGFLAGGDRGLRSVRALAGQPRAFDLVTNTRVPVISARLRHVLSESTRVDQATAVLQEGDLSRFGALLLDSHRSLRDDYEVSTPRLDALVRVAVGAGAAGARLTGAGLGGCIVAVCDRGNTSQVLAALDDAGPFVVRLADGASVSRF